jgi:type II secretion system protein I
MTRREHLTLRGGFTLIEVVVALAVLGVGLTILIESHYATVQLYVKTEDMAMAQLAVGQAVSQAEREVLAGKSSGKGELGARFPGYSYEYTAKAQDKTENPGLFAVDVTVRGPNLEKTMQYLIYDGTQVDVGKPAR